MPLFDPPAQYKAERLHDTIEEDDLESLIESTTAAILNEGVFNWHTPPEAGVLRRFFQGLLLVPERDLFIVRAPDNSICGAAILAHATARSELYGASATITAFFIVPYERNKGLGTLLLHKVIACARAGGAHVLDCRVRETLPDAIALLTSLGFTHWGTHPYFARIGDRTVRGLFFSKLLVPEGGTIQWQAAGGATTMPHHTPQAPTPTSTGLTLYPAIDLKGGACVRLRQGEMNDATHYSDDPPAQAKLFEAAGCRHLHIVDLDGAFAGRSANIDAVEGIIANTSLPVQLGGGLRDMKTIERWLEAGVSRVILGSVAVKDPELVRQAARAWPGRIVAGIDARQGRVATEGWAEVSELTTTDLARHMEDAGVAAIIFTEITRDGMLEGLDIEQTAALARHVSIPIIASGGVGTLEHLHALRRAAEETPGITGVIVGRALYDGRISLPEALQVLEGTC
ncbi:1-(5-phosphoribosyl)-5-[(5-phosphoribosylamino)methylideneamino]imidazole-4-carboxamide isomerase [Bombella sp. ESL0385]|uniref:1-(5-phosphoribosyl)-5-[(5- phosphoribosylamino)methylideneamino]imidazole-4- carboxamide isomerase n=1 Tax=Bombella sp. ESL0385 TaxID=2676446 RepID=UPI0012D93C6E|nr:1-(5-phosphoribosyl)-5-[(5-phosphoribosylamino)methylideneamino]imidazole-4-carboxamide isomerase [Bombella sp. ESL0385]MUG89607.1 1-(5-phosphoribosyl)-5-[(5-phosphoribosylamino)methylideneamino]imidazole-4-carboxamide isomerase [Bombella sp. ESL0385]